MFEDQRANVDVEIAMRSFCKKKWLDGAGGPTSSAAWVTTTIRAPELRTWQQWQFPKRQHTSALN